MKLKLVVGENVKGREFRHELSPTTLIVGKNKAGKTAILKAIELAILGYDSKRGTSNAKTFMLAGPGNRMSASVVLDNDHSFGHLWKQNKNGTITVEKIGSLNQAVPFIALDSTRYFALGPKPRVDYIFENARADGLTTPTAIIDSIVSSRLEFKEKAQQEKIDSLLTLLRAIPPLPVQDWIENATLVMDTQVKNANDEANRFKGANLAEVQMSNPESAPRPSHEIDVFLSEVNDHILSLTTIKNTLETQLRENSRLRQSRLELKNKLDRLPTDDSTVKRLEEELTALATELESYNPRDGDALIASQATARRKIIETRSSLDRAQGLVKKRSAEIQSLQEATACPTCHSVNDQWKEIVDQKIEEMKAELESATSEDALHTGNLLALQKQLEELSGQYSNWEFNSAELKPKAARRLAITNSLLPDARTALTNRTSLQDRLNAMEDPGPTEDLETKLQETATEINKAILRRDELSSELKVSVSHQQDKIRKAEITEQQKASLFALEAAKRVKEIIKEKREALVCQVFDSLMGRINQIAAWVTDTLIYQDGEIGKMVGGKFVTQETFSGTEQAVTFAAVSVALASTAPFKLVILDEMGRLDSENKRILVSELISLIEKGIIDQFIGIDTSADDYKRFARKESFKVIDLSAAE